LFLDVSHQGAVTLAAVGMDPADAGNLEHRMPNALPAPTVSQILELTEQSNSFPVRLFGDFLESPIQVLDALAFSLTPFEQLGFGFGDEFCAALLHCDSQRFESLPDCDAQFTVGHVSSVRSRFVAHVVTKTGCLKAVSGCHFEITNGRPRDDGPDSNDVGAANLR
jgi:hypothetical protein